MSRHENSVSARVGSDAAMWRRFLARNTSRNSEVETGASRSASVANIGLRLGFMPFVIMFDPQIERRGAGE